jgi:DedD protein
MPTSQQDTEITLGTGRMLILFFTVVLVCAGFFSIGFSLGRRTTMAAFNGPLGGASGMQSTARPSAGKDAPKPAPQPSNPEEKSASSNNAGTSTAPSGSQSQTTPSSGSAAPSTPENSPPVAGGYFVQVAAVSREEDADALVEALKKKQYPAFAANNSANDKYYHIQVGPYADFKDADAMRARLIADGYNPIVKK